jgi:bacterioferritin-associated ferredoxin
MSDNSSHQQLPVEGAPVFICICNGLRDRDVVDAARQCRSRCPRQAYEALGCEPQCGHCLDEAEALISADQAEMADA